MAQHVGCSVDTSTFEAAIEIRDRFSLVCVHGMGVLWVWRLVVVRLLSPGQAPV